MVSGTGSVPYSQVSLGFESRSAMILRDTFTMCIYIYISIFWTALWDTQMSLRALLIKFEDAELPAGQPLE